MIYWRLEQSRAEAVKQTGLKQGKQTRREDCDACYVEETVVTETWMENDLGSGLDLGAGHSHCRHFRCPSLHRMNQTYG